MNKNNMKFSDRLLEVFCVFTMIALLVGCGGNKETAKNNPGLTSTEASSIAWEDARVQFENPVLWRMIPTSDKKSDQMELDGQWMTSDKSSGWFIWYADADGENWMMYSIEGNEITNKDIGTREFGKPVIKTELPKESAEISMKEAAKTAQQQGADFEHLVWLEYSSDYKQSNYGDKPLWVFQFSEEIEEGITLNYHMFINAMTGETEGAVNSLGDEMTLPIDRVAMKQNRTNTHEEDLQKFLGYMVGEDAIWAVRQMSYSMVPNENMGQMWLNNFNSINKMEVISIEQANLSLWTDDWECYKVTMKIDTDEDPSVYGWDDGENIRWFTLVPEGAGGWKIDAIAASP